MIASCMIFLASFGVTTDINHTTLTRLMECRDNIPADMFDHVSLYVEFFDEENLYTALRIGWCESRGKSNAFRKEDNDSGVMQFIPNTWNWIAENYDIPMFDEWVIMRFDRPYTEQKTYATDFGFSHLKVQYSPYWNIKASSHLAEDIYKRTTWRDWNSSKWCWGDADKWEKTWRLQESW